MSTRTVKQPWLGLLFTALACGVVAAASSATAMPLVLLSDDRGVGAIGQSCTELECQPSESNSASPSPPFSTFNASVAAGDGGFASQNSSVSTSAMSGSGQAGGWSDIGWGEGTSTFDVTFSVGQGAAIDLDGSISAEDQIGFGYSETRLTLYEGAQIVYQAVADPFTTPVTVDFTGLLGPGTYRLVADADGLEWMVNGWSFTLTAQPATVPALAPAAIAGLALALAASGVGASRMAAG